MLGWCFQNKSWVVIVRYPDEAPLYLWLQDGLSRPIRLESSNANPLIIYRLSFRLKIQRRSREFPFKFNGCAAEL